MNKEEIELLNDILVSFDEYDVDWTKTACERNAEVIRKLQTQLTEANEKLEKIKEYVLGNRLYSIEITESEITKNKTCIPLYEEQASDTKQSTDILEIIKGSDNK